MTTFTVTSVSSLFCQSESMKSCMMPRRYKGGVAPRSPNFRANNPATQSEVDGGASLESLLTNVTRGPVSTVFEDGRFESQLYRANSGIDS
jgi:hypothetical protein